MSEQAYATIKGVKVPVMVVEGVELPLAAIEGYGGTIHVHDVHFDGDKTYRFKVDDPENGIVNQEVTYGFNPHSTSY